MLAPSSKVIYTKNRLQIVVTGDFFQLPPVTKSGEEPFFAFESEAWKKCIDHTVTLTQVYRQKDTRMSSTSATLVSLNVTISRIC